MRLNTLLLVSLVALCAAAAPVPNRLGYQGLLLNADGTPATGVVDITFTLYAGESGGAKLWEEVQHVALSEGFYATFLGDATELPASAFDGSERWLELTVG